MQRGQNPTTRVAGVMQFLQGLPAVALERKGTGPPSPLRGFGGQPPRGLPTVALERKGTGPPSPLRGFGGQPPPGLPTVALERKGTGPPSPLRGFGGQPPPGLPTVALERKGTGPPSPLRGFGGQPPPESRAEVGVPNGIRTRVLALKGPRPGPLDDGDARQEFLSLARDLCGRQRRARPRGAGWRTVRSGERWLLHYGTRGARRPALCKGRTSPDRKIATSQDRTIRSPARPQYRNIGLPSMSSTRGR
jgi:hypothetical protein